MGVRFGVIAEDGTDSDAIAVLLRRIAKEDMDQQIGVTARRCKGCGHLERKADAHLRDLAKTCVAAVIVRDLDRNMCTGVLNDVKDVLARLSKLPVPPDLAHHHICIPIEEIEAWFWSDQNVLDRVCRGKARARNDPSTLARPKEALEKASMLSGKPPRFSTSLNKDLAALLDLELCAQRCPAFKEMRSFVHLVLS